MMGINMVPESAFGVYGIFNTGWIYIGKGEIRNRLLAHLSGNDGNPCLLPSGPTHFVYEVTPFADSREKQLINEFLPPCNRRVG